MGKFIDLSEQRFSRLTAIKEAGRTRRGQVLWLCRCDCGATVIVESGKLRKNTTKSCGCLKREIASQSMRKLRTAMSLDNHSKSPLYRIWVEMQRRCYDEKSQSFKNYGGRGIEVCNEWQQSFSSFQAWSLANGYSRELTIDRKDNDGDYCPENCRWVSRKVQANNNRRNRNISYNGVTKTIAQWAEQTGMQWHTLYNRIDRGWPIERALTEPVHKTK